MEETLEYKELQSDQGLLNYFFDSYSICGPFLKVMNINLDSWRPHQDPEGWKQDPYGLDSYLSVDNLGGEDEEALGQITGTPIKGGA